MTRRGSQATTGLSQFAALCLFLLIIHTFDRYYSKMPRENLSTKIIQLVNLFDTNMNQSENWKIEIDEILKILEMKIQDYYQKMYKFDNSQFVTSFDTIKVENFGHFLHFLDQCYYKKTIFLFHQQGIYLNMDDHIQLTEFFMDSINRLILKHQIDYETFQMMFKHLKTFNRAWECYQNEFFSLEDIKNTITSEYYDQNPKSKIKPYCLLPFLNQLISRKIINPRFFLEEINEKLFLYLNPQQEKNQQQKNYQQDQAQNHQQSALTILELNKMPDLMQLKSQYKGLMKKYHPDINPNGLEKSKKINQAYQQILLTIEKGMN